MYFATERRLDVCPNALNHVKTDLYLFNVGRNFRDATTVLLSFIASGFSAQAIPKVNFARYKSFSVNSKSSKMFM